MTETIIVVYYASPAELEKFKTDNAVILTKLQPIYAHTSIYDGIRLEVIPVTL